MCIVEQKTYYQPDGSQKSFDRVNRCEFAISTGIPRCSNATRTSAAARLVEVKPETTTSCPKKNKNEIVTESNGRTHTYRGIGRRPSHKHKVGHSKPNINREPVAGPSSLHSPASEAFPSRRPSPVLRPATPNSAPPHMASFPPSLPSEPSVKVDRNGTAVYDLPPSLNMPRAWDNERRPAAYSARKVSFEDERPDQSHLRRPGLSVNTGSPYSASPPKVSPGLSRLPSLRHKRADSAFDTPKTRSVSPAPREDSEYAIRQAARENARRQKALDEAILRRQEELEEAENKSLDREAERAQYRREFDQLRLQPPHNNIDGSWSRHTSPPAPPSRPHPPQTRTRFASSSPLAAHSTHRHRNYGHATVHQYHYPDPPAPGPAQPSRRPSDSIRDRGREVIERERAKAAAEDRLNGVAVDDDAHAGASRDEPVFDEFEERIAGREYYYVSEGSARQEIRRKRRERDDSSRRREERREGFFYR